jgi:hypothetical protein
LLPSIETSVEYALKMIRKMQTELIKSMEVRQEALDEIYAHFDEYHKTTVFQENCGVGSRTARSRIVSTYGQDL